MKINTINEITKPENLLWAWKKAKSAYRVGDIWFDLLEFAAFEANLSNELQLLSDDIKQGKYILTSIKPIPFPKGVGKDEEDNEIVRVRQTFYISIRDQVMWLAVVNVIGPQLDYKMPFWSYGNRLYRSVWYDDVEKDGKPKKVLRTGWYRNSTKNIFRAWKQSWPLFRHSISLTIKKMSDRSEYTADETDMDENNKLLPVNFRVQYFENGYWNKSDVKELYWASIDFEKFYPQISIDVIKKNILSFCESVKEDSVFANFLMNITSFKVQIDKEWTDDYLKDIYLVVNENKVLEGLPTGLFVAGFLANVGLLEVDNKVVEKLKTNKNIAHFRYVDDHVIIGHDFDNVLKWISEYEELLNDSLTGAKINLTKTEPLDLAEFLKMSEEERLNKKSKKKALNACKLDPDFPSPLMTQTLAKVSNLADSDVDFLTENEENQLISDLEHLLITDFPDHELRSDTRVAFAATMLSSVMSKKRVNYSEVYSLRKKIFELTKKIDDIYKQDKSIETYKNHLTTRYLFHNHQAQERGEELIDQSHKEKVIKIADEIKAISKQVENKVKKIEDGVVSQKLYVFKLLLKAVKDNHDKVKLWWRTIDYCYNTQIAQYTLGEIFTCIEEVHNTGKSHKLSNQFLYSLFVLVISDRLIKATYCIYNDVDKLQQENADKFIDACINERFLDNIFKKECLSEMEYYKKTFAYFKLCLGSIIYANDNKYKSIIAKYNLIDWENNPQKWCSDNDVLIDDYLYYLMFHLNNKSNIKSSDVWSRFVSITGNQKLVTPFECKNSSIKSTTQGYINLFEWIDWCKEKSKEPESVFDPRLSEWFALKIVISIIEIQLRSTLSFNEFIKSSGDKTPYIIHPSNYLLPKKWIEEPFIKSWDDSLLKNIGGDVKLEMNVTEPDYYYTPYALITTYKPEEKFYTFYGIAVLLVQLITREYQFPWIWRIENNNVEYSNYIFANAKGITMSSMTQSIISSCTISRSRESFAIKNIFKEIPELTEDTLNDPPMILTIEDLIKHLKKAAEELEKYRISVSYNKPRQLIPISLVKITNKNNPFN